MILNAQLVTVGQKLIIFARFHDFRGWEFIRAWFVFWLRWHIWGCHRIPQHEYILFNAKHVTVRRNSAKLVSIVSHTPWRDLNDWEINMASSHTQTVTHQDAGILYKSLFMDKLVLVWLFLLSRYDIGLNSIWFFHFRFPGFMVWLQFGLKLEFSVSIFGFCVMVLLSWSSDFKAF